MKYEFEYCKLGNFAYHILRDPHRIKDYLLQWIMREWEIDHRAAPNEHWTVAWMNALPAMDFNLEILRLEDIHPNKDLMSVEDFQRSLKERAAEQEESILRGVSIEPLLINKNGYELMDGYTRYTVLQKYQPKEIYAYVGSV